MVIIDTENKSTVVENAATVNGRSKEMKTSEKLIQTFGKLFASLIYHKEHEKHNETA